MLVLINEIKEKINKYEELWSKIRYLIRSMTKSQMIMIKNILKSNLIRTTSYF